MKVIFDANIWISFVLRKRLSVLADVVKREDIDVIVSTPLINEINVVLSRPKFQKYITEEKLNCLHTLLLVYAKMVEVEQVKPFPIRDAKDLYLLAMSDNCGADYLVSGDEDLLVIKKYNKTVIENFSDFLKHVCAV